MTKMSILPGDMGPKLTSVDLDGEQPSVETLEVLEEVTVTAKRPFWHHWAPWAGLLVFLVGVARHGKTG